MAVNQMFVERGVRQIDLLAMLGVEIRKGQSRQIDLVLVERLVMRQRGRLLALVE
jgi:hypothetical protein